jgi:NADH-quinone oxidoreductase subunit G
MADELVNIEVNGQPLKARKGQMIMQATDPAGIYIPRFCYHEKLSVAANSRRHRSRCQPARRRSLKA